MRLDITVVNCEQNVCVTSVGINSSNATVLAACDHGDDFGGGGNDDKATVASTVLHYNLEDGAPLHPHPSHTGPKSKHDQSTFSSSSSATTYITSLSISSDGHYLATGCSIGTIRFFSLSSSSSSPSPAAVAGASATTMTLVKKSKNSHDGAVVTLSWNGDGTSLASAGDDGCVKVWSRSGLLRTQLASLPLPVYGLTWGPCSYVMSSRETTTSAGGGGGGGGAICVTNGCYLIVMGHVEGGGGGGGSDKTRRRWKNEHTLKNNGSDGGGGGVVLCVDWNHRSDVILSGSEDGRFRLFSSDGLCLFTSSLREYPVTCVSWRRPHRDDPGGCCFLVGSFESLELCDGNGGYVQCREVFRGAGSVTSVAWSHDGRKLVAGCAGDALVFGVVVDRVKEWGSWVAQLVESKKIVVGDYCRGGGRRDGDCVGEEAVEFSRDPVVEFALAYNKLVVCTQTQCHIFFLPSLRASKILDLKSSVHLIIMSATNFALVSLGADGINIYSYEGRHLSSPRFQGLRCDILSEDTISISQDTVAILDSTDPRIIRLFDATSGRSLDNTLSPSSLPDIKHDMNIIKISLSQRPNATQAERRLIFIDTKSELFISPVILTSSSSLTTTTGYSQKKRRSLPKKIASSVNSARWNDAADILTAISDSRLITWYFPEAPYVDVDLLSSARETTDASDFGKCRPVIISFHESTVIVQRGEDGATLARSVLVPALLIHDYCNGGMWERGLRLCRFVDAAGSSGGGVGGGDDCRSLLWATLAGLALQYQELKTAEVALGAIREVDKMQYIKFINSLTCNERRSAEMLLYRRCPEEAVSVLLQARPRPLIYRAIKIYIRLFQWEKALNIAVKRNAFIDVVLWYRKNYLKDFNKAEDSAPFQHYFQKYGNLNDEAIETVKRKAKADEERM